jgi:hypothetical protein
MSPGPPNPPSAGGEAHADGRAAQLRRKARNVAKLKGRIRKGQETAEMLALSDPEGLRQATVGEGAEVWKRGMLAALQPTTPCAHCGQSDYRSWAFRLFARVAKLIGADTQIMITLVQQLGVASMEEARRAIAADREAKEMSTTEAVQRTIEYLCYFKQQNPQEFIRLGGDRLK